MTKNICAKKKCISSIIREKFESFYQSRSCFGIEVLCNNQFDANQWTVPTILKLEIFLTLKVKFRANSSFDLCFSHRLH